MATLKKNTNISDFNVLLKSSLHPLTPVFVGSWRGHFATKWRGVSAELTYNTYLRNGWVVIDTGVKSETGTPLVEFSSWEPYVSHSNITFPNVISYKFFFRKAFWRVGFLTRTSVVADERWVSILPSYFSVINNSNRAGILNKKTGLLGSSLKPVTFLLSRFSLLVGNSRVSKLELVLTNSVLHSLFGQSLTQNFNQFFFFKSLRNRILVTSLKTKSFFGTVVKRAQTWSVRALLFKLVVMSLLVNSAGILATGNLFINSLIKDLLIRFLELLVRHKFNVTENLANLAQLLAAAAEFLKYRLVNLNLFTGLSFGSLFGILLKFFILSAEHLIVRFLPAVANPNSRFTIDLATRFASYKFKFAWLRADHAFFVSNRSKSGLGFSEFLKNFTPRFFFKKRRFAKNSEAPKRSGFTRRVYRGVSSKFRASLVGSLVHPRVARYRRSNVSKFKLSSLKKQFLFLYFWSFNFFSFFSITRLTKGVFWISTRLKFLFAVFLKFLKFYSFTVDYLKLAIVAGFKDRSAILLKFNSVRLFFWLLLKRVRTLLSAFFSFVGKFFNYYAAVNTESRFTPNAAVSDFVRRGFKFDEFYTSTYVLPNTLSTDGSTPVNALKTIFMVAYDGICRSIFKTSNLEVSKIRNYLRFTLFVRKATYINFRAKFAATISKLNLTGKSYWINLPNKQFTGLILKFLIAARLISSLASCYNVNKLLILVKRQLSCLPVKRFARTSIYSRKVVRFVSLIRFSGVLVGADLVFFLKKLNSVFTLIAKRTKKIKHILSRVKSRSDLCIDRAIIIAGQRDISFLWSLKTDYLFSNVLNAFFAKYKIVSALSSDFRFKAKAITNFLIGTNFKIKSYFNNHNFFSNNYFENNKSNIFLKLNWTLRFLLKSVSVRRVAVNIVSSSAYTISFGIKSLFGLNKHIENQFLTASLKTSSNWLSGTRNQLFDFSQPIGHILNTSGTSFSTGLFLAHGVDPLQQKIAPVTSYTTSLLVKPDFSYSPIGVLNVFRVSNLNIGLVSLMADHFKKMTRTKPILGYHINKIHAIRTILAESLLSVSNIKHAQAIMLVRDLNSFLNRSFGAGATKWNAQRRGFLFNRVYTKLVTHKAETNKLIRPALFAKLFLNGTGVAELSSKLKYLRGSVGYNLLRPVDTFFRRVTLIKKVKKKFRNFHKRGYKFNAKKSTFRTLNKEKNYNVGVVTKNRAIRFFTKLRNAAKLSFRRITRNGLRKSIIYKFLPYRVARLGVIEIFASLRAGISLPLAVARSTILPPKGLISQYMRTFVQILLKAQLIGASSPASFLFFSKMQQFAFRKIRAVRKILLRSNARKLGIFPKRNKRLKKMYWRLVNSGKLEPVTPDYTNSLLSIFDRRNKHSMELSTETSKRRFRFKTIKLQFSVKKRLWAHLVIMVNKLKSAIRLFRTKFWRRKFYRIFRGGRWLLRKKTKKRFLVLLVKAAYFLSKIRMNAINNLAALTSTSTSVLKHSSVLLLRAVYLRAVKHIFNCRLLSYRNLKVLFLRESKLVFIYKFIYFFFCKVLTFASKLDLLLRNSNSSDQLLALFLTKGVRFLSSPDWIKFGETNSSVYTFSNCALFGSENRSLALPISNILTGSALVFFLNRSQYESTPSFSVIHEMFGNSRSFHAWRRIAKTRTGGANWTFILSRVLPQLSISPLGVPLSGGLSFKKLDRKQNFRSKVFVSTLVRSNLRRFFNSPMYASAITQLLNASRRNVKAVTGGRKRTFFSKIHTKKRSGRIFSRALMSLKS